MVWIIDCRATTPDNACFLVAVYFCGNCAQTPNPPFSIMEEGRWFGDAGKRNTHGSMLTGVASLIADRTGGVMSQLSEKEQRCKIAVIWMLHSMMVHYLWRALVRSLTQKWNHNHQNVIIVYSTSLSSCVHRSTKHFRELAFCWTTEVGWGF